MNLTVPNLSSTTLPDLPEVLLLLAVVLCGGSVFYTHPNIQLPLHIFAAAFSAFVLFLRHCRIERRIFKTFILIQLFWFSILFIYLIIPPYGDTIRQSIYFYIKIFTVSVIVGIYINSRKRLTEHLYLILKIILAHGFFSFFISFFVNGHLVKFSGDIWSFLGLFYYTITGWEHFSLGGLTFWRNQGIFWEPGVFQVYMNLLFFMALFIKKEWIIGFFSAFLILTTWSTTGIFIMFVQLIYLIYKTFGYRLVVLFPIFIIILLPIFVLLKDNIEEKVYGERSISAGLRVVDFQTSLKIFEENPFFGIGVDFKLLRKFIDKHLEAGDVLEKITDKRVGATNSLATIFVSFGLPLTILILFFLSISNHFL